MTRRPCINYTHASHTHEPYYSHQTCKTKLCIESHSTGLCVGYVFGNHRSHLNSIHAEFYDLTDHIDHRESDSDLCFTVNPDGRYRLVGVGCVMTWWTLIIRKHSHIDPHVQLISWTVHTSDLINEEQKKKEDAYNDLARWSLLSLCAAGRGD